MLSLSKIFRNKKHNDISTAAGPGPPADKQSRAIKIVHAGGHVDQYYMATPAAFIMQNHPSSVLTRPEIFRRPWDSVVRAHEILIPGQKYYIVPRRTVKKLRRRVRKPSGGLSVMESVSRSLSGILVKPGIKLKAPPEQHRRPHVKFLDGNKLVPQNDEKKRRARVVFSWEPALKSINE